MLTTSSWRLNRLLNAEAQLWACAKDLESISRLERSIRQTTRDLVRPIALRVKPEKAAKPLDPK